jgi:hypothetical protein
MFEHGAFLRNRPSIAGATFCGALAQGKESETGAACDQTANRVADQFVSWKTNCSDLWSICGYFALDDLKLNARSRKRRRRQPLRLLPISLRPGALCLASSALLRP